MHSPSPVQGWEYTDGFQIQS